MPGPPPNAATAQARVTTGASSTVGSGLVSARISSTGGSSGSSVAVSVGGEIVRAGSRRTGAATASRSGRRRRSSSSCVPCSTMRPGVEHDQPVHARDGGQPVRDRDHRLAFHQAEQLLLDRELDLAVERRGGLVEHQDRRVLQHHARDRDALALPARELDAALADVRVVARAAVPVLQPDDELVRVRLARRGLDLRRRSRAAGRSGCWRRSSGAGATCPASPCRSPRAGSPASRGAMSCPSMRMLPCSSS